MPPLPILTTARRHPVVSLITALIAAAALAVAYFGTDHPVKAVVYLATMLAAVILIDVLVAWLGRSPDHPRPPRTPEEAFPVRNPKPETAVILGCTLIGLLAFSVSSILPMPGQIASLVLRIAALALRLLGIALIFPVVPAIYLLVRRYRPSELGFALPRPASLILISLPVQGLVIAAVILADPRGVTWSQIIAESGSDNSGTLVIVLRVLFIALLAAIPEEFFRLIVQTRLGALIRNQAAACLIAAILWALLHVPAILSHQSTDVPLPARLTRALLGSLVIVPLGLMWSYATWRTRSLYPALILHATNVWGLQNL